MKCIKLIPVLSQVWNLGQANKNFEVDQGVKNDNSHSYMSFSERSATLKVLRITRRFRLDLTLATVTLFFVAMACGTNNNETVTDDKSNSETPMKVSGIKGEVKIMTLDPGHFHAALVQKSMYDQVSPDVYVYAPEGDEVQSYLSLVESFNGRDDNPTSWNQKVYEGDDFFQKLIAEKPGNMMVIAGNNAKKTEYILEAVQNNINVLADKPMLITPDEFPMLEEAFETAEKNGVLLYDIMTERHEITTMLQKELSQIPSVFGELEKGTLENPAITKESIHHFFKYVSGKPLVRPPWFFDVTQEGEGIVDVSTHLVDLVQWECFPGVILDYKKDVEMLEAKRWPTELDAAMFEKVTGLKEKPSYLEKDIEGDVLNVYANGEFTYKLKGVHAKVSVIWNFQAPEGTADTHYSIMRGTKANLIIKQGKEEGYKPVLYVEALDAGIESDLNKAVTETLQSKYGGIALTKVNDGLWKMNIPERFKAGHEAHFSQVTEKYLNYLKEGKLPEWEVPNMITKYYTNMEALKLAMK